MNSLDVALICGFVLFYLFPEWTNVFVMILYSFWVPQIVCNITSRTRNAISKKYLIGISVLRLYIPLCKFATITLENKALIIMFSLSPFHVYDHRFLWLP
jgi:hypothetical protein